MIKTLALAATLCLAAGSAALADTSVVASLQTPVAARTQIVADGAVWTCAENACTTSADRAVSISACRALGREVGPVSAYTPAGRAFVASEMARCNAGLKPAATATASR